MAVINNGLDVFVVSNNTTIEKDKYVYQDNAHQLTFGQLGVFSNKTFKSVDFTTPTTANLHLEDYKFAIRTRDDIKIAGADINSKITSVTFSKYNAGSKFKVIVDPKVKFVKSTKYSLVIKFLDDQGGLYHYSYTTDASLQDQDTNRKTVIDKMVSEINNIFEDKVKASRENDNGTSNLKLEFDDPKGGEIRLEGGFDKSAVVTTTNVTFSSGRGEYVQELEYEALDYKHISFIPTPEARASYAHKLLYADLSKNYDLLTIGYLDRYSTATFTGDIGRTLVIAFESPTITNSGSGLYDKLKKFVELKDLLK